MKYASATYVEETRIGFVFLRTHTWQHHVLRVAINDLKRLVDGPLPKGGTWLDVGCGQGRSFRLIDEAFAPDQLIGAGMVDAYAAIVQAAGGGTGGGTDPGDGSNAVALVNGTPASANGGTSGGAALYKVTVPNGARALVLRTFGGSGDVALYVSKDIVPTISTHDIASVHTGNNESVVYARPVAGTYYLLVTSGSNLANFTVSVEASFTAPPP